MSYNTLKELLKNFGVKDDVNIKIDILKVADLNKDT